MDEADGKVSVEKLSERMLKSRASLASSKTLSLWMSFFMLGAASANAWILRDDRIRHDFPDEVGQWLLLAGLILNATSGLLIYQRAKSMIRKLESWLRIADDLRAFNALMSSQSGTTVATQYIMKTKMTIRTEEREEP